MKTRYVTAHIGISAGSDLHAIQRAARFQDLMKVILANGRKVLEDAGYPVPDEFDYIASFDVTRHVVPDEDE